MSYLFKFTSLILFDNQIEIQYNALLLRAPFAQVCLQISSLGGVYQF